MHTARHGGEDATESVLVAAQEDVLQQLNEKEREDVENGFAELEFFFGCVQFL
jgi:hypothetical protein